MNTIFCILNKNGFPGIFLIYESVFFLIILSASITTGIGAVFKYHIPAISISLYSENLSNSLAKTFFCHEMVMSCLFSIACSLLACLVQSLCILKF